MTASAINTDNHVFVSYARADSSFVRGLHAALKSRDVQAWVDWNDIPPSDEWLVAIEHAIDAADAFAFVMSPHSLGSGMCRHELGHALAVGKRLIVIVRDDSGADRAPDEVKRLQWIFARSDDEFARAIDLFIRALTTDLAKLRMHARTLVRAREWALHGHDTSFLLRGRDLRATEAWLASLDSIGPLPSSVHSEFVLASQQTEREESARWKQLYERSLARQLAAQSQLLVDQRGTALPLATLLAVEAARRSPSLETDQALRKALALTPLLYRPPYPWKFAATFCAENADRAAIIDGRKIEIRSWDNDTHLTTIEAPGALREKGIHHSPVTLSDDGARIAACVGDQLVCVWSVRLDGAVHTSQLVGQFELEAKAVGVALTSDAKRLAALTESRTYVFDVDAGNLLATIDHRAPMWNLSLHPQGHEVAVWSQHACEVWDLSRSDGNPTMIMSVPHGAATFRAQYSPQGHYVAMLAPMRFHVSVFHVASRKQVFVENRHVDLAFAPDDRFFAIASPEWDIGVYRLANCQRVFRMTHDDSVWRVKFSPDGRRLSSVSKDGTVRVWEVEREGREVARIVGAGAQAISTVFSRDSSQLLLLSSEQAQRCDARGFREWRLIELQSPVLAVDCARDVRHVAFGCRDGSWVVVDYSDAGNGRTVSQSLGRRAMGEQVMAISLVGANVLLRRGFGYHELLDLDTHASHESFDALQPTLAVAFDATSVLVASKETREIVTWRGDVVARRTADAPVRHLAGASSGTAAAALFDDGFVVVYTGDLSSEVARLKHEEAQDVAIDAAGKYLVSWHTADHDAQSVVRVVEIASEKEVSRFRLPSRINALSFDWRGLLVVLALQDKSVQVWSVEDGIALASFKHDRPATSACFTVDPGVIASAGWDGAVRIWPWKAKALVGAACMRIERNLSHEEWDQYLPGEPYRPTCERAR